MAVPARRNDLDEHNEEDRVLFEVVEEVDEEEEEEEEAPPHLRLLADAAKTGDVNALRFALDNHVGSIDDPIEDGDSVLHLCCLYGSLSCVRLLLERGANTEVKDEEGSIPLHDACAGGYTAIVELLINSADNSSIVKRMLGTSDTEGDTPLHHAARGEHLSVVQLLLSMGASPLVTNDFGKTPAELADPGMNVRRVLEEAACTYSMVSQ